MEALTNLRQSQPAASELDWTRHYLQIAQSASTPQELAYALNHAAGHRREAIRQYTSHVKAERAWAARTALFAAIPDARQIDWIDICKMSASSLLEELAAKDMAIHGAGIKSQGRAFANLLARKEVA